MENVGESNIQPQANRNYLPRMILREAPKLCPPETKD